MGVDYLFLGKMGTELLTIYTNSIFLSMLPKVKNRFPELLWTAYHKKSIIMVSL